jgi:hemoglobin
VALLGSVSPVAPAQDARGGSAEKNEQSLYNRLGGTYAIATVVDDFIERVLVNDTLNANPEIRAARERVPRPGLKFQVTALVIAATGGPYAYHGRDMYTAHKHLNITEQEWQALATDFKASLDHFRVPGSLQQELFAIVASTKEDIVLPGNESKALARLAYEAFAAGPAEALSKYFAEDLVDHNPNPGQAAGIEGVRQMIAMFRQGFPDLRMSVEDMVASGDKVAARVIARGTNKGPFMGQPPTGKTFIVEGVDIMRVVDGKIVERWGNFDDLGMMRQLGMAPMPPAGPTSAAPKMQPSAPMGGAALSPGDAMALSRAVLEAFDTGNTAPAEKALHAQSVSHDPASPPDMPLGIEGLKRAVSMYRTAFSDLRVTVHDQLAERDRVVTRWSAEGTHTGRLGDLDPTNKRARVTGITIDRIADGRIVESWTYWDTLGMMMQLGVIPMPGAASGVGR